MIFEMLAVIGVIFIASQWDDVVDCMKRSINHVKDIVIDVARTTGKVLSEMGYAARIMAKKLNDGVIEIIHHAFYRNKEGKITESYTVTKVDESEVPEWAKSGLGIKEKDITEKFKKETELTLELNK